MAHPMLYSGWRFLNCTLRTKHKLEEKELEMNGSRKITLAYLLVFISIICGSTGPSVFMTLPDHFRSVGVMYFLFIGGLILFVVGTLKLALSFRE